MIGRAIRQDGSLSKSDNGEKFYTIDNIPVNVANFCLIDVIKLYFMHVKGKTATHLPSFHYFH